MFFESTSISNLPYDIEPAYKDFVVDEAQVKVTKRDSMLETVAHLRLPSTERLVEIIETNGLIYDQKYYDSDISALIQEDDEDTRLLHVSLELRCKELDEEEVAKRDGKRQPEATTTMYPSRYAKEKSLQSPHLLPSAQQVYQAQWMRRMSQSKRVSSLTLMQFSLMQSMSLS